MAASAVATLQRAGSMGKFNLVIRCILFATLIGLGQSVFADTGDAASAPAPDDSSMETQAGGMIGGLGVSTAQAQADIAAQQAVCDADSSSDACQAANQRIAADQAQIQQNQAIARDVSSFVGNTGSADANSTGDDQVALNLKKCFTTLLAAWCIYNGNPAYPETLTAPPPPVVAVPIATGPGKK